MSRSIPAGLKAALQQATCEPYWAFEAMLDSAPLRVWTGVGERDIDGDTYTGASNLIGLEEMGETISLTAKATQVRLSGIPSTLVSAALSEPYQGRTARIYLGERSVSDVMEAFTGVLDVMSIDDDGQNSSIGVSIESKLVELERPRLWTYTPASHKSRNPGDTFFDWTADLADKQVPWGREDA